MLGRGGATQKWDRGGFTGLEDDSKSWARLPSLLALSPQDLETRNAELEHQLRATERSLEEARAERERARAEVGRAAQLLDVRLFELSELREGLARLAEAAP